MYLDWIFEPLGIEETKDKSQIRKAYAQKVKECHPEEHPKEWQRLHQAYKEALNYASGKHWYCYDELEDIENIGEEHLGEQSEQVEETMKASSELGLEDSSIEITELTQNDIYENLVAQAKIINDSDISSIKHQLENLMKLEDESLHVAWRNFFDSVAFLEFYEERSVIDLLGTTLKEIQVPRETAEFIQNELKLVIRKLRASKKYYKADMLSAIRKDFRSRINLNNISIGEIKGEWDYSEIFEGLVEKAKSTL